MSALTPTTSAKAYVAAAIAGLSALAAVIDNGVTANEALGVVVAVLASFGITYSVPNAPSDSSH